MQRFCRILALIFLLVTSCKSQNDKEKAMLSSLLGKEIVIPDSLVYRIQSMVIDYDMDNADYKIITYIDSTGCTSCRMKLKEWDKIINSYLSIDDVDIAFLMILDTDKFEDVKEILRRYCFNHPVAIDLKGIFAKANSLPDEMAYQTILLDMDNRIVAVGNPAVNPKIKAVYSRIINGDRELEVPQFCPLPVEALGVIFPGDTIVKQFALQNHTDIQLTIQALVPSCECVRAEISANSIDPDDTAIVTVTLIPDSLQGHIRRHIDIFYNEKDNPERLTLNGYIDNNHKNKQK